MARPPSNTTSSTVAHIDDVTDWRTVGAAVGLSHERARRVAWEALTKLRVALEARGVTREIVRAYFHDRDVRAGDNHYTAMVGKLRTTVTPDPLDALAVYADLDVARDGDTPADDV